MIELKSLGHAADDARAAKEGKGVNLPLLSLARRKVTLVGTPSFPITVRHVTRYKPLALRRNHMEPLTVYCDVLGERTELEEQPDLVCRSCGTTVTDLFTVAQPHYPL